MSVGNLTKSQLRPEYCQPTRSEKSKAGHQIADDFQGCKECPKASTCKKLCENARNFIQTDRRFFEQDLPDEIVMFPDYNTVRFSDLGETPQKNREALETMSEPLNLTTDKIQLNKYTVFIEKFFNKRTFKDIAEQLNLQENNVRTHWAEAVRDLEAIIQVLDLRGHATKYVLRPGSNLNKFTRDQKAFLMMYVFGFTHRETAKILGFKDDLIHRHARRLEQKFKAAFEGVAAE